MNHKIFMEDLKRYQGKDRDYEAEYSEYLMAHQNIGNGTMLIEAMESGDLLEDFCDSVGITVEQFEEMI